MNTIPSDTNKERDKKRRYERKRLKAQREAAAVVVGSLHDVLARQELQKKAGEALASGLSAEAVGAALGVSGSTVRRWVRDNPALQVAVNEGIQARLDRAEDALQRNIEAGKEISNIFFLKTLGQSRGYIERVAVDHSGGVEFRIVEPAIPVEGRVIDDKGE